LVFALGLQGDGLDWHLSDPDQDGAAGRPVQMMSGCGQMRRHSQSLNFGLLFGHRVAESVEIRYGSVEVQIAAEYGY
jgi:hypothetical protein